jgi:hypothetical protein
MQDFNRAWLYLIALRWDSGGLMRNKRVGLSWVFVGALLVGVSARGETASTLGRTYLRRAADEAGKISDSRNGVVEMDLFQVRAAFDTPDSYPETIRFFTQNLAVKIDVNEKPNDVIGSDAGTRISELTRLAESYAQCGNLPAAKELLEASVAAISTIPSWDTEGPENAWIDVARVHFMLHDVRASLLDLDHLDSLPTRAEIAERFLRKAREAVDLSAVQTYRDFALRMLSETTDPVSANLKREVLFNVAVDGGDFDLAQKQVDDESYTPKRLRRLGGLAAWERYDGQADRGAKTLAQLLSADISDRAAQFYAVEATAGRFAFARDRTGYEMCMKRADQIIAELAAGNSPDAKVAAHFRIDDRTETISDMLLLGDIDKAKAMLAATKDFPSDVAQSGLQNKVIIAEARDGRMADAAHDILQWEGHTNEALQYVGARMVQTGDSAELEKLLSGEDDPWDRAYLLMGAAQALSPLGVEIPMWE